MKVLIDTASCVFSFQLSPGAKVVEGDATLNRTYSALTLEQLRRLYRNHTGYTLETTDYNAAVQTCKTLAVRLITSEQRRGYHVHKDEEGDAG